MFIIHGIWKEEMRYTEIIKLFEQIADTNDFIKDFDHGRREDLNDVFTSKAKEFPKLYVTPEPFVINERTIDFTVSVDVFSLSTDSSKSSQYQDKIISDCTDIINDIVSTLYHCLDNDNEIELPVTVEPYYFKMSEYVAGVKSTITIKTKRESNPCNINCPN